MPIAVRQFLSRLEESAEIKLLLIALVLYALLLGVYNVLDVICVAPLLA